MTGPPPTAILIVGMHRSGTSALAGVLAKLGVPLGERLLEPALDNPKGYWEHEDVVVVHERLLAELGSRWDDVRALPDNWLESESAQRAAAAIEEIISRDFSATPIWSVKDPRLCRLLPLWLDVLARRGVRPVTLFMVRNPDEVSASIQARNHWQPLVGKFLWLRYMTEAVAATTDVLRGVALYDDLLADPIATVKAALTSLEVMPDRTISVEEHEAVAGFIDASDRHHTIPSHAKPSTVFDSIAETLYESLVEVAHGSKKWDAVEQASAAFDREWTISGPCIDPVADMASKIEVTAQVARGEILRISSELTAQIRWSEETKAKHEALQAENSDLSSRLIAQIRWSEEAQAKHEALQAENAELSSRLTAQIRWSEEAQAKHEAMQIAHAELSSRLFSEIDAHRRIESEFVRCRETCEQLTGELQNVSTERDHLRAESEEARTSRLATEAELRAVYGSSSWKSTKPLRSVSRLFRRGIRPASNSTRKPE